MKLPYNRYFITPSFLAMSSCAIDLSDRSIKYGQLQATSKGLIVSKFGQVKIPAGVVVSGKIEDEKQLILILKDLKKKENLDFIRVSLPEEQLYLFTLSIPKTENTNLREAILLQIEEHVPLKAIDITFDYDIISDDNNFLVKVVAVSTIIMESYLSVFEQSGLTPLSFEHEAQSITRAVVPAGENHPIMIVDFGNSRTGVAIVHNRRVLLATTVEIGGSNLTDMIAKNFSISYEKAEEMKREYGLSGYSNIEDIFPIILNGISVLRDELNKQYLYWKGHNSLNQEEPKIDHIILCGGDSNLSGLSNYLETSMNIKVENANVWSNILEMKQSIPDISFEESLSYATVFGLALKDYIYTPNTFINILPEEQKKQINKNYWIRFTTMFLHVMAFLSITATILLFPSYLLSKEKETDAESRLESFNLANPLLKTDNLEKDISDINSKTNLLISNTGESVLDVIINNIIQTKPDGIIFSQILYSKRADGVKLLDIHGVSRDRTTLRDLKSLLENNENFSKVDLPASNFIEVSNINFKVSVVLR